MNMKRKILSLVAAITVVGSVSAYAATCNRASSPAAPVVKNASVYTAQSIPGSSVQKTADKASPSTAAPSAVSVNSQSCSGSGCTSQSSCKANGCTSGTACPTGNCNASANCGAATSSGNKTVVSGSSCKSGASSCGSAVCVTSGSNCGTGCSANVQSILNSICGKTGNSCTGNSYQGNTSPSKPTSSQPQASQPQASQPQVSQPSASGYSAFQNEVVRLVNVQRSKNGLPALSADSLLMTTATVKSQDMAKNNYFDHTSPTYGSPFDLMKRYGVSYRAAGENIAMGQTSPAQVMDGWMNSAGHRANILNSSYTKIGVGVAQNASGNYYWTQHFIG